MRSRQGRFILLILGMVILVTFVLVMGVGCAKTQKPIARLGKGTIRRVQFTPDGQYVAVATSLGVELRDPETLEERAFLESAGFGWPLQVMDIAPDGKRIAVAGRNGIALWDVETKPRLAAKKGYVRSFKFSPDGKLLAMSKRGKAFDHIEVWSGDGKRRIATIKGYDIYVHALRFSPNGKLLAGCTLEACRLWEIPSCREVAAIPLSMGVRPEVLFSPDGALMVLQGDTSRDTGGTLIWDVSARQEAAKFGPSDAIAFHPDGTLLAILPEGRPQQIKLWDVAKRQELTTAIASLDVHHSRAIRFSPDGKLLAWADSKKLASEQEIIKLWNVATQDEVCVLPIGRGRGSESSFDFSHDGKRLVSSAIDGTLRMWEWTTMPEVVPPKVSVREHAGYLRTVSFGPDGRLLVSGDVYASYLWDVTTKRKVTTVERRDDWIWNTDISPDGTTLAVRTNEVLELWDIGAETKVRTLSQIGPSSGPDVFRLSHTGRLLALSSGSLRGRHIRIWDLNVNPEVAVLKGYPPVRFSPDGKLLAARSASGDSVILWDVETQREVAELEGEAHYVSAFGFSPDGALLATRAKEGIVLWNVRRRQEVATLKIEADWIYDIDFSPDGKLLAAGTRDDVRLWDVKARREVTTLEVEAVGTVSYNVYDIDFSPDGRLLAVGGSRGQRGEFLELWDVVSRQKVSGLIEGGAYVCFSPDGEVLAYHPSIYSYAVSILDVATQQKKVTIRADYSGSYGGPEGNPVEFSPDGALIAATAGSEYTLLWDMQGQREVALLPGSAQSIAFSPDGALLAIADRHGNVQLWDVEAAKRSVTLLPFEFEEGSTMGGEEAFLCFSPDDALLAAGAGLTVRVWDMKTKQETEAIGAPHVDEPQSESEESRIRYVDFGPDGSLRAIAASEKTISLWDAASRQFVTLADNLKRSGGRKKVSACLSSDGSLLAIAGIDAETIELWNVKTKRKTAKLKGHRERIRSIGFSPDGALVASASEDGTVLLWQVEDR